MPWEPVPGWAAEALPLPQECSSGELEEASIPQGLEPSALESAWARDLAPGAPTHPVTPGNYIQTVDYSIFWEVLGPCFLADSLRGASS